MGAKGLKAAAEELRQARGDLPGQFANAFERAGGLARKGGDGLKRHYEFVLEAQELRARYAELLARAPIVTEKGKQFLARLELEKRAEQFRETSGDAADWARQKVVVAIAYLIRGLQYIQAKITPQQNKQLAMLPASAEEPARDRRAPRTSLSGSCCCLPLPMLAATTDEETPAPIPAPTNREGRRRNARHLTQPHQRPRVPQAGCVMSLRARLLGRLWRCRYRGSPPEESAGPLPSGNPALFWTGFQA